MKQELEDQFKDLFDDIRKIFVYLISLNKNKEYEINAVVKEFDDVTPELGEVIPFVEEIVNVPISFELYKKEENQNQHFRESPTGMDDSTSDNGSSLAESIISFFRPEKEEQATMESQLKFVSCFSRI